MMKSQWKLCCIVRGECECGASFPNSKFTIHPMDVYVVSSSSSQRCILFTATCTFTWSGVMRVQRFVYTNLKYAHGMLLACRKMLMLLVGFHHILLSTTSEILKCNHSTSTGYGVHCYHLVYCECCHHVPQAKALSRGDNGSQTSTTKQSPSYNKFNNLN